MFCVSLFSFKKHFSTFFFFFFKICVIYLHVPFFYFFTFLFLTLLYYSTLLYFLLFFTSLLLYFVTSFLTFLSKNYFYFLLLTFCWCKTRFVASRSISPSTGKSLLGFNSGLDNEWHGESRWLKEWTVWVAFALGGIVVEDDVRCYMG